jgi:hypothetical protein
MIRAAHGDGGNDDVVATDDEMNVRCQELYVRRRGRIRASRHRERRHRKRCNRAAKGLHQRIPEIVPATVAEQREEFGNGSFRSGNLPRPQPGIRLLTKDKEG